MTKESMDQIMEMLREKNIRIHELQAEVERLERKFDEALADARKAAGMILCDNCDDYVTKWVEMESLTPGGQPDRFCHKCAPHYQKKEVS
jgi:hypothetical protein